jgi:uncharacterized UPF0160 family protein
VTPAYLIQTSLASRVRHLNTEWNESPEAADANGVTPRFLEAVQLTGKELKGVILRAAKHWLPAQTIISEAFQFRFFIHKSGSILKLTVPAPWEDYLFDLEKSAAVVSKETTAESKSNQPQVLYVLYPSINSKKETTWMSRAVPVAPKSFVSRKGFPQAWRGLKGGALDKACGVEQATFVHASGFLAGHPTYEGILQMTLLSLSASL